MAITFVAAGTAYNRITSGTTWTWNAPAGLVSGDVMIAAVSFDANSSQKTVTLPSGWTLIKNVYYDAAVDLQHVVAYRVAGSSEPSSWGGTISASTPTAAAAVSAYRGVQGVGLSSSGSTGFGTSVSTGSVNNTIANSWRVTVGAYTSGSASYTISSSEVTRRVLYTADDSGDTGAIQGAIWDSNGVISTGSTSRTVSRSANWTAGAGVILLLTPQTGTPASGTWASTIGKVTADGDGEVHNDAVVDAAIGAVAFDGDGYGQPPVVTGDLGATLGAVSADGEGGTDVLGSMDAIVAVSADVVAETRAFGIRVINVEADDRTIVVESREVAD